jgi:hypothetical protein
MAPRMTVARRIGYTLAALVNLALLWVVNVWPGWQAVPFLTEQTTTILPLVNASLVVGIASNAFYVLADPPWLKALGAVVTSAFSVAIAVRTFTVFPFDFGEDSSLWEPMAEVFLIFLMVVTALALLVQVVQFVRTVLAGPPEPDPPPPDGPYVPYPDQPYPDQPGSERR